MFPMFPLRRGASFIDEVNMKFTAFLTGVGFGAAVGILVVQQSGEDTRQKISDTVEQGKKFVTDKVAETVSKVAEAAHKKIDNVADRVTPEATSVAFPGGEARAS
jgi:gas vesicle protein